MLQDSFTIKELFKKKIDREINGVVQAGQRDEEVIKDELEEYVMTKEISENMAYFFKNYAFSFDNTTTKMGVWISGFFGSGKSHFLKILSYILNNEIVYGKRAVDFFNEKTDDRELLETLHRSASYTSHSILFNVDSKSAGGKKEKATIVEVFLKVFNEYLGFSSTPWIANLERQLADEGVYTQFVEHFEEIDGTKWADSRARVLFKKKSFVEALSQLGYTKDTAEAVLAASNKNYQISSDELAMLVAKHVKNQGENYRLTFLVDEIGQYIGDDDDLMLNLQTITEDLGNHCHGKVWVIVTSQEQIDAVTKLKGTENFSKIQGRFATKIHLTSSNTDEVIKRRLLEKTPATADRLKIDFDQVGQSLNNTLTFEKDKSVLQNGYKNANDYASIYPFVPYQVELLQRVFNKVRRQGEAGAHLSQGERSLLNAFQEVAIQLMNEDTNQLARFSQFYETVKRFLSTTVASTITDARKRQGISDFDVEVLKVLFMIKGIDEVKATVENVTTLLVDSVDCIKNELEKQVTKSLIRLRQKLLIAENADRTFVFLSDDEQEINREIQNENVNEANVIDALGRVFFEEIVQLRSYRYQKTHDFEFNKAFDTYNRGGKTNALTLQVYTSEVTEDQARVDANSGTMIMYIPEHYAEKFFEPMQYAQKIYSYANKKISTSLTEKQKKVLEERRQQISEFEKKAREALEEAAGNAKYFIQGQDYEFKGSIENQLQSAFEILVRNTYSYLGYIDTPMPVKNANELIYDWATKGLPGRLDGTFDNHLAYNTLIRYLEESRHRQIVTLKILIDKYKDVPFGWSENDIAGLVAAALFNKKIKLSYLNEGFEETHPQFISRITKASEREKVVIEAQIGIPPRVRKDVVEVMRELFNFYDIGETYNDVAKNIRGQIQKNFIEIIEGIQRIKQHEDKQYPYPGGIKLSKIKNSILDLLSITKQEKFVDEFNEIDEDLEEWLEDVQHLNSFYNGNAIRHFDESVRLLKERYYDIEAAQNESEVQKIKNNIIGILTNDNPFKEIPNLPILNQQLKGSLSLYVARQLESHLEDLKSIEQDFQDLLVQHNEIDKVKNTVEPALKKLQDRIAQYKTMESISQVYLYKQMSIDELNRVKETIADFILDKKKVQFRPNDFVNIFIDRNELVIENTEQLENVLEKIKNDLTKQIISGKTIVIKK